MNQNFLDSTRKLYRYYEGLGRRTMDQLADQDLFFEPTPGINSIAVIVKHLHGNMLSRWTDFLTSDGEKEWRERDDEFVQTMNDRATVYQLWDAGWNCVFNAIDPLTAEDVEKIIYIRNEGHTVMEAMQRQLTHYATHVGQIIYLGKLIKGDEWKSLSIPKGQSKAFNAKKFAEGKGKRHFTDEQ